MRSYIPANELFQALPLLEQFETRSAKGAMANPFYAINYISGLLKKSIAKGDCVAPYFLHYMHEVGYYHVDNIDELPDLKNVPAHRAKGDVWVLAYKLYLSTLALIGYAHIIPVSIPSSNQYHAKHNRKQLATTHQTKIKAHIQASITQLSSLNHPLGDLFCGKLLEMTVDNLDAAEVYYQQSAAHPNVWGMLEYWNFLKRHPSRQQPTAFFHTLQIQLGLLEQVTDGWDHLLEYFLKHGTFRIYQQWGIHGGLHGEVNCCLALMLAYVKSDSQWVYPISASEGLDEALKWFYWLTSKHVEYSDFFERVVNLTYALLKNIDQSSYETHVLVLHFINYIDQKIILSNTTDQALLDNGLGIFMVLEQYLGELCYHVFQKNPANPILKQNYHFASELALYFEKQENYKLAEQWFRIALHLKSEDAITIFNLANILLIQKKEQQECIELFLSAAEKGCESSVRCLLHFIFTKNCLSVSQIDRCIKIIQALMSDIQFFQYDVNDQSKEQQPLILFLQMLRQYKVYSRDFRIWKKLALDELEKQTTQKEALLQESFIAYLAQPMEKDCTSESDPVENNHDEFVSDSVETDDHAEPAMVLQASVESQETDAFEMKMHRALTKLRELSEKPMRHLTMKDRLEAEKSFTILMNHPEIQWSTKGRTSGSRISINGNTLHLPHGHDRMSPGAQQAIKRHINEVVDEVEHSLSSAIVC